VQSAYTALQKITAGASWAETNCQESQTEGAISMSTKGRGRIFNNITECVGNTPLIRINRLTEGCVADVLIKLESANPMWSVKDRIGLAMIEDAERSGKINKDTQLVEPTSGNTGIALAYVCAARGYKLKVVMPESMSVERRQVIRAFGAELVLTPAAKGMPGAVETANEIIANTPGSFMPSQFENPANPEVHRQTTAEEIWNDTEGACDIIVSGTGTGGTITGVGEAIKKKKPGFKCIAVEPEESPVLTQQRAGEPLKPGKHRIQGIGAGFIPTVLNVDNIDEVVLVCEEDAFATAGKIAMSEGIFVGPSSGANICAAIRVAQRPENEGKMIVTIGCDLGERYLSMPVFPQA
jgi:cysteine synthase A